MFRTILTTLLFALATPALAFEIEAMSPEERDIFRSEIRDYLLENPEVLMEAIAVLEDRRAQQAAVAEVQMLEDTICMVFLKWYFADFAQKHPTDKVVSIVAKTSRKMSQSARHRVLKEFDLPDDLASAMKAA